MAAAFAYLAIYTTNDIIKFCDIVYLADANRMWKQRNVNVFLVYWPVYQTHRNTQMQKHIKQNTATHTPYTLRLLTPSAL